MFEVCRCDGLTMRGLAMVIIDSSLLRKSNEGLVAMVMLAVAGAEADKV